MKEPHCNHAHNATPSLVKGQPLLQKPRGPSRPVLPVIHTTQQTKALLDAAWDHDPALVPYLALGYFWGLRPRELWTFEWRRWSGAGTHVLIPCSVRWRPERVVQLFNPLQAAWISPFAHNANGPDACGVPRRIKRILAMVIGRLGIIPFSWRILRQTWLVHLVADPSLPVIKLMASTDAHLTAFAHPHPFPAPLAPQEVDTYFSLMPPDRPPGTLAAKNLPQDGGAK